MLQEHNAEKTEYCRMCAKTLHQEGLLWFLYNVDDFKLHPIIFIVHDLQNRKISKKLLQIRNLHDCLEGK